VPRKGLRPFCVYGMIKNSLIIKLEGDRPDGVIRVMSDRISLADGKARSVETITRTFKYNSDHFYGELEINRKMMTEMMKNFKANTYGQEIYVNIAHHDWEGAAGKITRLFQQGNKLKAEIDWTEMGLDAIRNRGFRYFSAEFAENWEDPETEKRHGAVLLGAALTIRPRVKRLDPIDPEKLTMLSEDSDDDTPIIVLPNVTRMLSEEITAMWEQLIKELQEQLKKHVQLDEGAIKALCDSFKASVTNVTEEKDAKALQEKFQEAGKQLAEQIEAGKLDKEATIKIDLSGGDREAKQLTEEDIAKAVQKKLDENAAAAKKLQEDRDVLVKAFTDAIDAAEGLKALGETELAEMKKEGSELITAGMTEDQVKRLADHHISMGNKLAVQRQLAARGMQPGAAGQIHISVDESNSIKQLQETVDQRLGFKEMSESKRYGRTGGSLPQENKALADKFLEIYDREHARELHAEAKHLAGGDGIISDVAVPATFERTVIREALYMLVGLQFVDTGTLPFASSHIIPYSYRDTAAAGRDNTRVYEGGSIPRAGVIQTSETAYPIPQKLAFEVSDELRYLTGANIINWDSVMENQRNASRIVGEDLEGMLFNEILRAADEYGATAVAAEALNAQLDGANNVFVLANFPVVRPRNVYDLQGNQVGATSNPITVTYNDGGGAAAIDEYDGTGNQAAGNYYSLDYNLGEIRIVDETGALQTPANTDTLVVDYYYATNVYAFDSDNGGVDLDLYWNNFLYRYGLRKAVIEDDRYYMANFGLMSGTLRTSVEQARQFGANFQRPGTDLTTDGNVGRIKDVPNFKTTAPGLWMGDVRCIIGERNQTRLRMMKPWTMGELQDQKDANGRFTGKKEAYGDQFLILHTPTQLKQAYTSIVVYSTTARVARAE